MTTGTDLELRFAALVDLVNGTGPPDPRVTNHAPAIHSAGSLRRRTKSLAGTRRASCRALPHTTSGEQRKPYLDWSQASEISTAASFLGQAYGLSFNLLVVLHHHDDDHALGSDTIVDFHRKARQRLDRRGQSIFPFIYVHEADGDGRLSTRLACYVAFERDADFQTWVTTKFVRSPAGRRSTFGAIERCQRDTRADRVTFHHRCVQQLLCGVDPTIEARDEVGRPVPLVDCLGIPLRIRHSLGVPTCAQRFGMADALGPTRRAVEHEALPLLDVFADGAWRWIGRGWELAEYTSRRAELNALDEERRCIDARFADGGNTLVQARRAAALAALDECRARPPENRDRSWTCWRPSVARAEQT